MPEIVDNTQAQNLVSSNQGTNRVPKLDANSFFFLENEVFTQSVAQKFGVISENEFRTTASVTIVSKKIISVCSGQVLLQPFAGDSSKVNLILKPYKQPVTGLAVKYFIYRGLPKNQFLDTNDKVLLAGSGFITHVQTEFNSYYNQDASLLPKPELFGKFIGFPDSVAPVNESQQETDLIDDYFYKISQTFDDETGDITNAKRAFEMPMIKAGLDLTGSISGEIGFDIVLNFGDYYIENDTNPFKLNLAFARAPYGLLNATTITDAYQKKLLREAVAQFIDPAAYFGLHSNGGKIYKFGVSTPAETPAAIYTLISSFITKNTVYIYVQSNRQRSYNFYNKYVVSDTNLNNMKIGTSEASLSETTYETDFWPLKVFIATPVAGSDSMAIAMQFTTDKDSNTCLFGGAIATVNSANNEGFVDSKDLIQEPDVNGVVSNFTKTVILSTPTASNFTISSIIQLVYLGKNIILSRPGIDDNDPATPEPDPIYFTTKYMDDVFDLVDATSFLKADQIYHVHSYKPTLYNQQGIDKNRGKVVAYTQRTQNTIVISETENLTLFTYLSIVENEVSNHSNFLPNASSNKESSGYSVQQTSETYFELSNLPTNEYIKLSVITETLQEIQTLKLTTNDGSLPTTLVLGISESENNILKSLISSVNFSKIYFEPVLGTESNLISTENINYKKFKLGVLVDTPTYGNSILFPPASDLINVYTIDGLIFFSKKYSENVNQTNDIGNVVNDINIKI